MGFELNCYFFFQVLVFGRGLRGRGRNRDFDITDSTVVVSLLGRIFWVFRQRFVNLELIGLVWFCRIESFPMTGQTTVKKIPF